MNKNTQHIAKMNQREKPQKYHISKYSEGWASGGSSSYKTYRDSTVIATFSQSFMLGNKQVDFKSFKTGIFTAEFWIFSMFSLFTSFFVILTHSYDQIPLFPRLMTIVFLMITITPLIFSLLKSNRRVIFKLDSTDFVTLYFDNKQERNQFLSNYQNKDVKQGNGDSFDADVTLNAYDIRNEKMLSKVKVTIKDNGIAISNSYQTEVFDNYISKSKDLMWQLYPFASVFVIMPCYLIISTLLSGTFESGLLFTLVFLVAGLLIMLVPSIISRGNLLVLTNDGYLRFQFVNPKERVYFIRLLKTLKKSKNLDGDMSFVKDKFNDYHVYNTEKPKFILRFWVATLIYLGILIGVCFSGDIVIVLLMGYMGFVFYSFFLIMCKDDLRENFVIKNRYKRLWQSSIITAKVKDILIEDFLLGSKYLFNVWIHVTFTDLNGEEQIQKFNRIMVKKYPILKINQVVTLAVNKKTVSLLFDGRQEYSSIPNNIVKDQDEVISLLKKADQLVAKNTNKSKVFEQSRWLYYLAYGLSVTVLTGLVALFIKLAIDGADSTTRIASTVLIGVFGAILGLIIYRLYQIFSKSTQNNKVIKKGIKTNGLVVCLNERRVHRHNNGGSDSYIYHFNVKYVYLNHNGHIKVGYSNEIFYSNSSRYGVPTLKYFSIVDVYYIDEKSVIAL